MIRPFKNIKTETLYSIKDCNNLNYTQLCLLLIVLKSRRKQSQTLLNSNIK